jgi:hypothetical protein
MQCHSAKWQSLIAIMPSVFLPSGILLNAILMGIMLPSVIIMITVLLTFILLNVILLRVIAECHFTDKGSAGCLSSECHSVYQYCVECQSAECVFVNVMAPSPNESYLLTFFASFQARRCHSVD